MDKLTMAHQYAMKHLENSKGNITIISLTAFAWQYADAMQAEADERIKSEVEEKRKNVREMLKADNTFLEKEGGHFDDVEWQPDWSQAPDNANSWTKISDSEAVWWVGYPFFNGWRFTDVLGASYTCGYAPLFGYNGRWQDSLRKRP